MVKAKDGDFFISDWVRNRNTLEYLAIWERIHNPDFNYGEFATITQKAGLNNYKISVKEWVARSEEHTSELQSRGQLVCRLLLEKKNNDNKLYNDNNK